MRSFETTLESSEELAAVNAIIGSIGESPVSTLEGDLNADVANARRLLHAANRGIQSKGWTFNIEEGVSLLPDKFSGMIPYHSDYLRVTADGAQTTYVNRGGYFYDRTARTDKFNGAITVTLIRLREFDEMPECFREWIIKRASKQFNMRYFGAPELDAILSEEEEEARQDCNTYENDYGNFNMLDGDVWTSGQLTR